MLACFFIIIIQISKTIRTYIIHILNLEHQKVLVEKHEAVWARLKHSWLMTLFYVKISHADIISSLHNTIYFSSRTALHQGKRHTFLNVNFQIRTLFRHFALAARGCVYEKIFSIISKSDRFSCSNRRSFSPLAGFREFIRIRARARVYRCVESLKSC